MSDRVKVEIEEVDLDADEGGVVPGVRATCSDCGHETESYGQGPKSRRRCLALMREECEEGLENFYVDGDA